VSGLAAFSVWRSFIRTGLAVLWVIHKPTFRGIISRHEWFDRAEGIEYSGKKSDAVLIVDSRSLRNEPQFNVSIGLLERNRLDVLNTNLHLLAGSERSLQAQQVLLSTAVDPWVYAILYLWRDRQVDAIIETTA
jgi:hypothetical protein